MEQRILSSSLLHFTHVYYINSRIKKKKRYVIKNKNLTFYYFSDTEYMLYRYTLSCLPTRFRIYYG